jgi:hypothetical protein
MSLLRNFKIVIDNQGVVIGELTALGPELLPRRAGASQVSFRLFRGSPDRVTR